MAQQLINPNYSDLAPVLKVKKLSPSAVVPTRASPLSPGYDISSPTDLKIPAKGQVAIPTDLAIGVPDGTYARIAARSGLGSKYGVQVGARVIDAADDINKNVRVVLYNHSEVDFEVKRGDLIAQLIVEKIIPPVMVEIPDLETDYIAKDLPLLKGRVVIQLSDLENASAQPAPSVPSAQ